MKKILTIVFAILSLCCLFSIVTSAVDIGGVDYTLTESASGNTATVSMANRTMQTKNVVIPKVVTYGDNSYTVTTIARQAFEANTFIETLVIEADLGATGLKDYAFSQCSNLKQVTLPSSLTVIPGRCFRQCTSLTEITLPSNLQELGSCAFWKCTGLISIDIPASVTVISDKVFEECTALKTVKSAAPVIGERMFWNCKAVESAIFTNTVSIKKQAFHYFGVKNGNGVVVLPDTLTTVESYAFEYCFFSTVVLPKSITTVAENGFTCINNYCKSIKFTGTEEQANELFSSYGISYELVNHCEIYYNNIHEDDSNPCVINCTRCNTSGVAEANPVHSEKTAVLYENGFDKQGVVLITCANKGCEHNITSEAQALFTCLGYSASTGTMGGGIALGFKVNSEAIAAYTEATGKTVAYGVFAVAQTKLGENDIFDKDGNMIDVALGSDIKTTHSVFEIKVTNIPGDKADAKLALGAYVKLTEGEAVEYSYMQPDTPKADEKYCFVSYNDVAGTPSTGEESAQ